MSMTAQHNIRFFDDPHLGIEFVYLSGSAQSYPAHNHISVYVYSFVLQGCITLTKNRQAITISAPQGFMIVPYEPHSITADLPYDMLSVCVQKSVFAKYDTATIDDRLTQKIQL
jgi:quercetin dioxygenase-like cupin family protein